MHRRSFIQNSALTLGALTLLQKNMLNTLTDDPWKITMLTDHIGIFTEKGGTIAFALTRTGIIVVDAEFPEQSQHLIDELKKRSEQPFQLLINTHHHGDHTSGNISFKGIVPHVLAHANSLTNQQNVAVKSKTEDKQLYPDQTYTNTWQQNVAGEDMALYYYGAGHTNGDSFVHFERANIVHAGDLVFNRNHPYVDRGAGASIQSWIKVLDQAMNKFDNKTTYIFGHCRTGFEVTGKKDDVKKFQDYLGNVLMLVDSQIKAGKTKDEILALTSIPGSEEWQGDGIQRPLGAAYDELTTK